MELIKVKIRKGEGVALAKIFNVSPDWVCKALCGKTNSETAKKIRKAAVNRGNDGIYKQVTVR